MNVFTKEELRHLDVSLEQFKFSCINLEFEEKIKSLRDKIQSMIDGYCEHNFIGHMTGSACFPYCNKCRKVIINDNQ